MFFSVFFPTALENYSLLPLKKQQWSCEGLAPSDPVLNSCCYP